jgi:hypothetical protein
VVRGLKPVFATAHLTRITFIKIARRKSPELQKTYYTQECRLKLQDVWASALF